MLALLDKHGITIATPVQKKIIPAIFEKRDIFAQSETGSGKTISYAIPIIERLQQKDGISTLVLVPTRELCVQITGEFIKFSDGRQRGAITPVYGGVSLSNQIKKLRNTNIIIATPGRLIDLLNRNALRLDRIKYLVLDEADRMLDMGFLRDVENIIKRIPEHRQTMLFSATFSREITALSRKYLKDPLHVQLDAAVKPEFLSQTYYKTTKEDKLPLLIQLMKKERDLSLVFCNRKHITSKLARTLNGHGINAKCLHGDLTQAQRERVTSEFRHKKINVLIATDVASRGLHINDISHVYNYEIPKDVDSYTHRVGRTARAGNKGEAISLVTGGEDEKFFKQILFMYKGVITLKSIKPEISISAFRKPKESKHRNKNHKKSNHYGKQQHKQ